MSSGQWAFLVGLTVPGAAARYSGTTPFPGMLAASGYWQMNDTSLYLFGGYGWIGTAATWGMFMVY
jgi:hypothetical protein